MLSKDIANYKINIEIKSNQVKQNIIEVLTSLNLSTTKNDFDKIDTKIVYATIVELSNDKLKKNEMEKIILIDVPTKIYGELRNIFVFLFIDILKFDFTSLESTLGSIIFTIFTFFIKFLYISNTGVFLVSEQFSLYAKPRISILEFFILRSELIVLKINFL